MEVSASKKMVASKINEALICSKKKFILAQSLSGSGIC